MMKLLAVLQVTTGKTIVKPSRKTEELQQIKLHIVP